MRRCATTLAGEMHANEHHLLIEILQSNHGRGTHLEIGTAAGGTLCIMLNAFQEERRPPFVVVDTMQYFPNQMEIVNENLRRNNIEPNSINFRIMTSHEAFHRAETTKESFDFILIDAIHELYDVTRDLRWTRLLNTKGIVCFHDYCFRFPGVMAAVDRFQIRNPNYKRIGLADSLLFLQKIAPSQDLEIGEIDEEYASNFDPQLKQIGARFRSFCRESESWNTDRSAH